MAGRIARATGGLRLLPADGRRAAVDTLLAMLGVTLFIALLDGWLFRQALDPGYVAFFTSPLLPRMAGLMMVSALEEIRFRLLLMTLGAVLVVAWRGRLSPRAAVAIILASQLANVGHLLVAQPLYGALRYWAVGSVWGWLYWRHGWLAALLGHAATHLLLDPALLVVLAH